jgi:hypothetical protein
MQSSHREGVRSRKNHEPEDLPGHNQPSLVVREGEGAGSIRPETILRVIHGLGDFLFEACRALKLDPRLDCEVKG